MNRLILKLTISGSFFIIILGSLWHFVYEWSGNNQIIGAIAPVNESVWEHLKLAYFPMLLFALVEWYFLRKAGKNLIYAVAAKSTLVIILITAFFYTYTGIIGFNTLWADILITFVVPVIIGQSVSYKMLTEEKQSREKIIATATVIVLLFAFIFFTFQAPHLPLFKDKNDNSYGINQTK